MYENIFYFTDHFMCIDMNLGDEFIIKSKMNNRILETFDNLKPIDELRAEMISKCDFLENLLFGYEEPYKM
jgi:hypothetical protein